MAKVRTTIFYLRRVHFQPVICFPEIIENDATAIVRPCTQHNARRTVRFRCDPCAMECIRYEQQRENADERYGHFAFNAARLLFEFAYLFRVDLLFGRRFNASYVLGQEMRNGYTGQNAHDRCQNQHQSDHNTLDYELPFCFISFQCRNENWEDTYSEVDACDSVKNDENVGVRQFGEAKVQTSWEKEHQNLKWKREDDGVK